MRYYIRYREDLKWEEINRTQAAMWVLDESPDNRWRLSMLTIPNYIKCNGVEIKVVGDNGEQPDEEYPNAVPNEFIDRSMRYEGLRDAARTAFNVGKKILWTVFSFVFHLYIFLVEIIWKIAKLLIAETVRIIKEEQY